MQVSYPGVYVTEIPSTLRPITAVSTSTGAFIDFFREGPLDRAVQIFGMADFDRIYGGVDDRSEASYAISQFFLNGGGSCWVIRTSKSTGKAVLASTTVRDAANTTDVMRVDASSEGAWGNAVRLIVEPAPNDSGGVSDKLFNLYVSRYAAPNDRRAPLANEKYLKLSLDETNARYFVSVVNGASQLVQLTDLRTGSPKATVLPAANGTVGGALGTGFPALNGKKFTATITRPSGAAATVTGTINVPLTIGTDARALRAAFEAALRGATVTSGTVDAGYSGATVDLVGNAFVVRTGRRSPTYVPAETIALANVTGTEPLTTLGLATAQVQAQEHAVGATTSGTDGDKPDATALKGDPNLKTGMYALEDVDLFNILCIPRAADLDSGSFTAVVGEAVTYCETKRAFFLVDIPLAVDNPQAVKDFVDANASTLRSANAAVYFPRVQIPDSNDEYRLRSVGPSGTMAGIYARTDSGRGVWKAPAGIEGVLRGVGALDYLLTDPENGVLNPLAIDCLRSFPVYGQVAWGARTLLGADVIASEWKYVPIRRLALMIEESLFRGTKWVVFEANDEPLWAKIRQNVGAFMMNLFRQGAFQGSTPDKAFYVKCDGETTTAIDRNLGIVNIEVGFAPLKPAEFVVIKIQQIPDLT